jgi:prepilin-type N-terminal cleavage/methylation domain-containing protein
MRRGGAPVRIFPAQSGVRCAGFTLVEVIVVLVILAILAAIAIPALTGYIDKAQIRDLEMRTRTQLIAMQTMINLQYAENGGFVKETVPYTDTSSYFLKIMRSPDADIGPDFSVWCVTERGRQEYVSLTGDTQSLVNVYNPWRQYISAYFAPGGGIKFLEYIDNDYTFGGSGVMRNNYIAEDMDALSPSVEAKVISIYGSVANAKAHGITKGYNIVDWTDATTFTKLN